MKYKEKTYLLRTFVSNSYRKLRTLEYVTSQRNVMASNSNHSLLTAVQKLTGQENYAAWKFKMETWLIDDELWDSVSMGNVVEQDPRKIDRARAKICLMIDPTIHVQDRPCKTAIEAWDKLKDLYEDKGLVNRLGVIRKLINTRLESSQCTKDYVSEILRVSQMLDVKSKTSFWP